MERVSKLEYFKKYSRIVNPWQDKLRKRRESIPRSGTVGTYCSSIFRFLRNCHTVFSSHCTNSLLPTVYKSSLFSTSSPTFVIWDHFDDSHSDRGEVMFHCGLIFISLMVSDIEELLFMCLLGIYMSFLQKCLFRFSAHFKIRLLLFWCWIVCIVHIF